MPLLNFQKRFAPLVESGQKTQTIRAPRKHPVKVGDTLYLYTGCRTKSARRLGVGLVTSVLDIGISRDYVKLGRRKHRIYADIVLRLAMADGFSSVCEFQKWFAQHHGFPFYGQVIRWRLQCEP